MSGDGRTQPQSTSHTRSGLPGCGSGTARWQFSGLALVWLALVAWSWIGNRGLALSESAWLALVVAGLWVWGRLSLDLLGLDRLVRPTLPWVLVLGTLTLCIVLVPVRLVFPIRLSLVWGGALAVGAAGAALRVGRWKQLPGSDSAEQYGLATVVVCLLAATFWCQFLLPPTWSDEGGTIYVPMRDYFVFAGYAEMLAAPESSANFGQFAMGGAPINYYHYFSFALPAVRSLVGGHSAYSALVNFWCPFGLVVAGLAAYCLAVVWFDQQGGFWAAVAVLVLPDTGRWTWLGLPDGLSYFSLIRVLQILPSASYGLAAAAISLGCLSLAYRRARPGPAWASAGFLVATIGFKAEVFCALAPVALLLTLVLGWPAQRAGWLRTWAVSLGAASGGFLVVLALLIPYAPPVGLETPPCERFLTMISSKVVGDGLLEPWVGSLGLGEPLTPAHLAARGWFLSLLALRWLAPALVAMLLGQCLLFRRLGALDVVPLAALASYVGLALLVPPNDGAYLWLLQHIPFVWLYFVVAVWLAGTLVWAAKVLGRHRSAWSVAWALPLLIPSLWLGRQQPLDDFREQAIYTRVWIPQGLVDCVEQVRRHARPGDLVQESENDVYYYVAGLTGRPCYVAWTLLMVYPFERPVMNEFRRRLAWHLALKQATSTEEIAVLVRQEGVRWYLLADETSVSWPEEFRQQASLVRGNYRLFDWTNLLEPPRGIPMAGGSADRLELQVAELDGRAVLGQVKNEPNRAVGRNR